MRHWDSWDPGSPNFKQTRPWVAPANGYESFFETGKTWQNNVAFTGSNDKGDFRLSYTNVNQLGTLPNSQLDRNTLAVSGSYKLTDKLTAAASVSYVRQEASGRNATGYNGDNVMQGFTQWWQNQLDINRLRDYIRTDGLQQTWNPKGISVDPNTGNLISFNPAPEYFDSPYWTVERNQNRDVRDRVFGHFQVNYQLTDDFSVSVKAMRDGFAFESMDARAKGGVSQSRFRQNFRNFNETNFEARINYHKNLSEKFSVDAYVGGNMMSQERSHLFATTNGGLALDGFYHIANGISPPTITFEKQERKINSIFGLASFGYNHILFVDLTLRNDWSSTLPVDNNSYIYPSVTTSFVFSDLGPLQNSFVSFGKLRASYGVAANDANPYRLYDVFAPQQPNFGTNPRYTVPNARNNPILKPEFTKELEFGLDMNFMENRFGFDVAWFSRRTTDQIFNVASSAATGFTSQLVNGGEMLNKGLEVMLRATPVKVGDFRWDISLNFARLWNEVVELKTGTNRINLGGTWAADQIIEKGRSYMALYGYDFARHSSGAVLIDEDGFPSYTDDFVYLGSVMPEVTGGLRNTFSWKGISASALLDFQRGGVIHSTSLQWANYSGMTPETVFQNRNGQRVDIREQGLVLDGVKADGSRNDTPIDPQLYYQSYWDVASPNVYKADFVKLREIRVGYTIPTRVLGNLPIRDLNISFVGRNLSILSSDLPYLDPQAVTGAGNLQGLENAQVPSTRSYGFNIGFNF